MAQYHITLSRDKVGSGVGFWDSNCLTNSSISVFLSDDAPNIPLLIPKQYFQQTNINTNEYIDKLI